jgi:deoxycytidylate deaminase
MNRSWINGFLTAEAAALESDAPTKAFQVGAALYSGNRLLSIGCNKYAKTHPQYAQRPRNEKHYSVTIHAELMALVRRKHYDGDSNLILYVYRGLADGNPGNSKPCELCQEAIKLARVRRVRFYNEKGEPEEWKISYGRR